MNKLSDTQGQAPGCRAAELQVYCYFLEIVSVLIHFVLFVMLLIADL